MATDITPTAAQGQLQGNVLLYSRPEPLNKEQHGNLGISPVDAPFNFARSAHAVPLAVTEFGPASLSYPIIFTGAEYLPLAVMSIRQNENLFLLDNGYFEMDVYVPAYIRRYPFVLANDDINEKLIVCIERDAEAVQVNGEVPLFENGELSPFAQQAIEFCTNFETERQRTMAFVETLKELDLFELREQTFTPANPDGTPGEVIKLADFFAVSETKLNALAPAKLAELRDTGALQQMYVHLNSLMNWERLVSKTMQRDQAQAPVAANA